jgi:cysteinyl-tRNA synthetase
LLKLNPGKESAVDVQKIEEQFYEAMSDDLNTPIAISHLFDAVRIINSINDDKVKIDAESLEKLKSLFQVFIFDILGLVEDKASNDDLSSDLIDMILNLRMDIKANKDYATADKIRDELTKLGVVIKDKKDGFDWEIE